MKDALYEVESMLRIGELDRTRDAMLVETTVAKLRKHSRMYALTEEMMSIVSEMAEKRGLLLMGGRMDGPT